MSQGLWVRERLELLQAMKSSPFHLKPGECDYSPPLELVGLYIAHSTVSRMVAKGELEANSAAYLNAALGCHAFCVLHHCTHESISQHNEEHEAFENMVFRLACLVIFFDDGYKEAHRAHHQRTNEETDPDLVLSHSSLPLFGHLVRIIGQHDQYIHLGAAHTHPDTLGLLKTFGLLDTVVTSKWLVKMLGMVNWDNQTLKMGSNYVLKLLSTHGQYEHVSRVLETTWRGASSVSLMLLGLFFARYPHRNGIACVNEVDSYYDQTFRGQDQVDLWMMGEGAHHMHHAKSDVAYSRLPKVAEDVEQRHPHLKTSTRGNADLHSLEYTHSMPPKVGCNDAPPMQHAWDKTQAMMESKDLLGTDPVAACAKMAGAALDTALYVCKTADRALLRKLCQDMRFPESESGAQLPPSQWHNTVFSEYATERLKASSDLIRSEVRKVAETVGSAMPVIKTDAELKSHYIDFFINLAGTVGCAEDRMEFFKTCSASIAKEPNPDTTLLRDRLVSFLEAPVPSNFSRTKKLSYPYNKALTRKRLSNLFFGARSNL